MDHVNLALDCKLLKATQYNGSMFIHKFEKQFSTKVAWVQPFIRDEIINGVNILWGYEKTINQQTMSMSVVTVQSLRCQPMETT